ncbi:MAG: hypothetical protein IMX02_00545 [Limnochordaceae bacterium]|nr:hypothetical protein [Limnochordaceae bacterium]
MRHTWRQVAFVAAVAMALAGALGGVALAAKPLPPIVMLSDTGDVVRTMNQAIQEMVRKNLGLEIQIEYMDFKTRLERMRNSNFSVVFAGWGPDYDDPMTFLDLWVTDSAFNDGKWSNQRYDELLAAAKNTTDQEKRMQYFVEAEKILAQEAPIAPIYWRSRLSLYKPWVKGIIRRPVGAEAEYKWAYTQGRPGGDSPMVLNLNLGEEPPDLDPATSTDTVSFLILNATLDGLVRKDAQGQIRPGSGLAESWTVSPDQKVYTFKLRKATWDDGTPITADDFVYQWRRVIDPRTASQYQFMMELAGIANGSKIAQMDAKDGEAIDKALETFGVKALDERTLQVTLEKPNPLFLELTTFISFLPAPKHLVEKYGDKYAAEASTIGASGPFRIAEWKHQYELVLEKNPKYWDAKNVKLQKIHFDMITDAGTALQMYEQGKLDIAGVASRYVDVYRNHPDLQPPWPDGSAFYWEFNTLDPVLKNAKVRRAIALAIDRKAFADRVLRNGSYPATSLTPPVITDPAKGGIFQKRVGELFPATPDVKLARQLLREGLTELGYEVPEVARQ